MRSNIIIAAGLLLFITILMTTPKKQLSEDARLVTDRGIVTEVYQNGFKDFVLKLKGQSKSYYLDVSDQAQWSLSQLQSRLLYKPVTIQYPQSGSPERSQRSDQYISRLESDGEIVFAEE